MAFLRSINAQISTVSKEFRSALASKEMLIALFMGIASGFPLLLTKTTLKTWLREEGVDLTTIGFFAFAGLPYTLKFLWAPFLDRYMPPIFGRRKGWLIISQILLVIGIALMGMNTPKSNITWVGVFAIWIAFFSATQDILVDAYRRETLTDKQLGLGSSLYVYGYRLAIWITRTAPLVIAEFFSWQLAYYSMAALMSLNLLASFWAEEPKVQFNEEKDLKKILFDPIKEFFQRDSISSACFILSFILFYKLGDAYASLLTSPFYIDIGFSKSEIAAVDGTVGFISQFVGLFLGGGLIVYLGINRSLWICGFLQMISTAGFSFLAYIGADTLIFSGVVAFENISSGMGTATFVAFMAALTDKRFTATQYALLTSLMSVPMNLIGASSGILAESVGWFWFFLICTVAAIPGLILLSKVAPLKSKN